MVMNFEDELYFSISSGAELKILSVANDTFAAVATLSPIAITGDPVRGTMDRVDDTLYYIDQGEDIRPINVTVPGVPVAAARVSLGVDAPTSFRARDIRGYETNVDSKLRILNLTVPLAPTVTSTIDLTAFAVPQLLPESVCIDPLDDDLLWIISNDAAGSFLAAYNVSNPAAVTQYANPLFLGGLASERPSYLIVVRGLIHKLAFFVHVGLLWSVNVDDPTDLQVLSNRPVSPPGGYLNIDVFGSAASRTQRLSMTNTLNANVYIYNLNQPASPVPMDSIHYSSGREPVVPRMNANRVYVLAKKG